MMAYFIIQYQEITFLNVLPIVSEIALSVWDVMELMEAATSFPKPWFLLTSSNFITGNTSLQRFFHKIIVSLCSSSRKYLPNIQTWITTICLSLILSSNNGILWKKWPKITQVLFLKWPSYLGMQQNRLHIFRIMSQRILKACTQEWRFNTVSSFYCFIKGISKWTWHFFSFTASMWHWRIQ